MSLQLGSFFTGVNDARPLLLIPAARLLHSRGSVRVVLRVVGSPSSLCTWVGEVLVVVPGISVCVSGLGTHFHRVRGHRPLEVCKSPWSLRGSREYAPMAGYAACCTPYIRHSPLVPVHGAASHNRWGVAETPLSVKTQRRTSDCPFNFRHHVLMQGGF